MGSVDREKRIEELERKVAGLEEVLSEQGKPLRDQIAIIMDRMIYDDLDGAPDCGLETYWPVLLGAADRIAALRPKGGTSVEGWIRPHASFKLTGEQVFTTNAEIVKGEADWERAAIVTPRTGSTTATASRPTSSHAND